LRASSVLISFDDMPSEKTKYSLCSIYIFCIYIYTYMYLIIYLF
uniref:Ovule protein n=1 Tax=Strongyloides papillosus TaxID=174720 RepID=A0A0N5BZU4_STREA